MARSRVESRQIYTSNGQFKGSSTSAQNNSQHSNSYLTNNSLALYKQEQSLNIYKHNIQNIIQTGTEKDVATETRIDAHGQKQV